MKFIHSVKDLTITTQINVEELSHLAALGFKGVINSRFDYEDTQQPLSEELQIAAKYLGLQYYHLPIHQDSTEIIDTQVAAFETALQSIDGATIIFCRTGRRSLELVNPADKTQIKKHPPSQM